MVVSQTGVGAWPRPRRGAAGPRPGFSVAISRALGVIVVTIHGTLAADSSGRLRSILWDVIEREDNRNVVIDLRDMTLAEGADLELFVDAAQGAQARGGYVRLSGASHSCSEALTRTGLTGVLEVEPSGSRPVALRPR